jgi:hypothetical protein
MTGYQQTNQTVRSVCEVARYTKLHIIYNVLFSGKLLHLANPWSSQRYQMNQLIQCIYQHSRPFSSSLFCIRKMPFQINLSRSNRKHRMEQKCINIKQPIFEQTIFHSILAFLLCFWVKQFLYNSGSFIFFFTSYFQDQLNYLINASF